jgi:hypothetical protein
MIPFNKQKCAIKKQRISYMNLKKKKQLMCNEVSCTVKQYHVFASFKFKLAAMCNEAEIYTQLGINIHIIVSKSMNKNTINIHR